MLKEHTTATEGQALEEKQAKATGFSAGRDNKPAADLSIVELKILEHTNKITCAFLELKR